MLDKSQVTCWVVSDGGAGMENQCLGLAEALGLTPVVKRIKLCTPWRQLSPFLRCGLKWAFRADGDAISAPWPDLLIASGRASVPASLYVHRTTKALGAKRTITIQIQNPVIDPSFFDLVVTPRHDQIDGPNVMTTRGSMHRITPALLASEAKKHQGLWADLPSPRVAVVIGGTSSAFQLTPREMKPIVDQLAALAKKTGGSLLITTSRRTGEANLALLQEGLKNVPAYIWDMKGANPYFGILGAAEAILVTEDSTNLVSEACSTGKPVHIIELAGGSDKFRRFHQALRDDGLTRPFTGALEKWSYQPLNDVQLVADRVEAMVRKVRG